MEIYMTGGGWVAAQNYGRWSEGGRVDLSAATGELALPPARDLFERPLARYGRFDRYTKAGCAAVALALRDACLPRPGEDCVIGLVSSSLYESTETDLAYYRTTIEQDGALASPNLFSYTLPGIVLGECAAHFGLTGPTLCLGERDGLGMAALRAAVSMLGAAKADLMLAGWIEAPPREFAKRDPEVAAVGAAFVVLDRRASSALSHRRLVCKNGKVVLENEREATSLLSLFEVAP